MGEARYAEIPLKKVRRDPGERVAAAAEGGAACWGSVAGGATGSGFPAGTWFAAGVVVAACTVPAAETVDGPRCRLHPADNIAMVRKHKNFALM